jgi:hypothetical protein
MRPGSRDPGEQSERSLSTMSEESSRQSDLEEFADVASTHESSPEVKTLRNGVEQNSEQLGELVDVVKTLTEQVHRILDADGAAVGSVDDGTPADPGDEKPIRGFQ